MKNQWYMTRDVNNRTRYLKLTIYPTLFANTIVVDQEFGAVRFAKPTGIKRYFFDTLGDAKLYLQKYIDKKKKRGYVGE